MFFRSLLAGITSIATALGALQADEGGSTSGVSEKSGLRTAELEFFEARIRPVLIAHCYECHNSGDLAEGDLSVDHRDAMVAGGSLGTLFDSEQPDKSLLLQVIRHEVDGLEMPESGPKLDPQVIADFESWVRQGAADPRSEPPSDQEIDAAVSWEAIRQRRQSWWSFQPIVLPQMPEPASNKSGSLTSSTVSTSAVIDRFVNAGIQKAGLEVAGRADKLVLLRRLSFALSGLPPTPEQIRKFQADTSDGAYENLVDELLGASSFGERWARHWMDWIRYAESHGSEGDPAIADAWRYRDYLIRALNDDVGYDQLLLEHLAGDLVAQPRINPELGINESMIGPAHWRMVFHGFAPTDALDEKVRFTDDAIDVFSKAFQALTISCARCHNHKFDPISQADYYALFGVLASTRPGRAVIDDETVLQPGRRRMRQIKSELRDLIAAAWTADVPKQSKAWARDEGIPAAASGPTHPLNPLHAVFVDANAGQAAKTIEDERRRLDEVSADIRTAIGQIQEHRRRDYSRRWSFADPATTSYRYGHGLTDRPIAAGDFAVSASGNRLITGILPAGFHTHSLSTKDGGRLTVDEFAIDQKSTLWIRGSGGGNAATRIVIQNYPRNGTVFPVQSLKSSQHGSSTWHRFDLGYWQGDRMHFELATARDAPLLVKPDVRSWFSVREAVVISEGDLPPPDLSREYLLALFAAESIPDGSSEIAERPFSDANDLLARYTSGILAAIDHWQRGIASDDEALLLDALVRYDVLPSAVSAIDGTSALVSEYRELESALPIPRRVPSLDEWKAQDHPLFVRGDHHSPGEVVPRRYLEAFRSPPFATSDSGRLELAQSLLAEDNPLTRRVIVNRVWHHLFGQGIVNTPDNFGRMGTLPTHPELLDFLAVQFSDQQQWSLKQLVRSIVLSETWQRSSVVPGGTLVIDPDNRLLSHFSLRRLDAEAIRDAMLSVSGQMKPDLYGKPVGGTVPRRSVYVNVIRNRPDPFLTVFDAPVPFSAKGRRDVTNVPAQSLMLMNDPFVERSAIHLAGQMKAWKSTATAGADSRQQVSNIGSETIVELWQRLYGRSPRPIEILQTGQFFARLSEQDQIDRDNRNQLTKTRTRLVARRDGLIHEARLRLESDHQRQRASGPPIDAIGSWDFETDLRDSIGGRHGRRVGAVKIDAGALVLDGNGFVATEVLDQTLAAKSFEVVLTMESLDQRGGGVMGIQTVNGATFDTLVFGEKMPRHWLAGSDHHRRTKSFASAEPESVSNAAVHLLITSSGDGRVTCYRNGEPYGRSFDTDLQVYPAGGSQIIFGIRHGTRVSAGRMFRGRLHAARLYDRELSADDARLLATRATGEVLLAQVLDSLDASARHELDGLETKLVDIDAEMKALGPPRPDHAALEDLIHSMLNMKEFIYVR